MGTICLYDFGHSIKCYDQSLRDVPQGYFVEHWYRLELDGDILSYSVGVFSPETSTVTIGCKIGQFMLKISKGQGGTLFGLHVSI